MSNLKRKIKNLLNSYRGFHEPDKKLIVVIFTILTFGLISLSSASSVIAYDKFGDPYYYFKHQLFGLALGLIAFAIFSRIDYHIWKEYAFGFLFFSIVLLLLVFIPGLSAHYGKARSWINVFGYSVQPSEFVKLSFLLYLAAWLEARKKDLGEIEKGIGPFIVGSGGVLGRGLGASRQKYMYLPEVSGDSIFAIIAEETGFVVSVIFIILFLYLFYCGYKIAKNAPDDFGRILAIGISSWIVMQALINIGGIINAMPMTGVPLPLVSYGGSAILAALTACGILVNISRQTKGEKTGRR